MSDQTDHTLMCAAEAQCEPLSYVDAQEALANAIERPTIHEAFAFRKGFKAGESAVIARMEKAGSAAAQVTSLRISRETAKELERAATWLDGTWTSADTSELRRIARAVRYVASKATCYITPASGSAPAQEPVPSLLANVPDGLITLEVRETPRQSPTTSKDPK